MAVWIFDGIAIKDSFNFSLHFIQTLIRIGNTIKSYRTRAPFRETFEPNIHRNMRFFIFYTIFSVYNIHGNATILEEQNNRSVFATMEEVSYEQLNNSAA